MSQDLRLDGNQEIANGRTFQSSMNLEESIWIENNESTGIENSDRNPTITVWNNY